MEPVGLNAAACCRMFEAGPATGCAKERFVAGLEMSFLSAIARIAHVTSWLVGSGARPSERLLGSARRAARGP